jgi:hypothetical protein
LARTVQMYGCGLLIAHNLFLGEYPTYPRTRIQKPKPKLVKKTISKDGRVRVVPFPHYMFS